MAVSDPTVEVFRMSWDELLRRVAEAAVAGDRRARAELQLLADEERLAQAEGREPGDAISRLSASAVLRPIQRRPGRIGDDDG